MDLFYLSTSRPDDAPRFLPLEAWQRVPLILVNLWALILHMICSKRPSPQV